MLCPLCHPSQPLSYPLSVDAQKVLKFLQSSGFNTVGKLKLDTGLSGQIQTLIRNYIRYLLEREVKSTTWLDMLSEQIKSEVK
jgi:hypothetical protein